MRHIIVEGPDGAGKTDLIRDLANHLGLPVHPRFVQSRTHPPEDLDMRVMDDLATPAFTSGYHTWIYDRHPLISELIYGPITRGSLNGQFQFPSWVDRMLATLVPRVVVVWCLPPYAEVVNNVNPERDRPDVVGKIYDVYQAYERSHKMWAGPFVVHDYTTAPAGSANRGVLISRIRRIAQEGEREWATNPR
jgi:hypothetical protein